MHVLSHNRLISHPVKTQHINNRILLMVPVHLFVPNTKV